MNDPKIVPKLVITSRSRQWWNDELTAARKELRWVQNKAFRLRFDTDHPIHKLKRRKRNDYGWLLESTKRSYWENFLRSTSNANLWEAHRIAQCNASDGGITNVLPLQTTDADGVTHIHDTNQSKAEAFFHSFFPKPLAQFTPFPKSSYPPPKFSFPPPTNLQIQRAINKLQPYKAPGPNGIPNAVWIRCLDLLLPYISPIIKASFNLNVYPDIWKHSTTIVIRKPSRPDYSKPNAYRPIALLDTLGKITSSIVSETLITQSQQLNLLPPQHIGCRPGHTASDALHYITSTIKNAWPYFSSTSKAPSLQS